MLIVVQGHDHPAMQRSEAWASAARLGQRRARRRNASIAPLKCATASRIKPCSVEVLADGGVHVRFHQPQRAGHSRVNTWCFTSRRRLPRRRCGRPDCVKDCASSARTRRKLFWRTGSDRPHSYPATAIIPPICPGGMRKGRPSAQNHWGDEAYGAPLSEVASLALPALEPAAPLPILAEDARKTRLRRALRSLCGNQNFEIASLAALKDRNVARLPYSLKILLENLLRFEDGVNVTRDDIEALLKWEPKAAPSYEISFSPSRVIMQDFTGVACDRRPRRHARSDRSSSAAIPDEDQPAGRRPSWSSTTRCKSVAYELGAADALENNRTSTISRNTERYAFLRWGSDRVRQFQSGAAEHRHRAPGERRASRPERLVFDHRRRTACAWAYPDTLVGTDSAHHDGQRPRRAGLGRGRHRGRSGHAGPAGLHAHSGSGRLQAHRHARRAASPPPTSC